LELEHEPLLEDKLHEHEPMGPELDCKPAEASALAGAQADTDVSASADASVDADTSADVYA